MLDTSRQEPQPKSSEQQLELQEIVEPKDDKDERSRTMTLESSNEEMRMNENTPMNYETAAINLDLTKISMENAPNFTVDRVSEQNNAESTNKDLIMAALDPRTSTKDELRSSIIQRRRTILSTDVSPYRKEMQRKTSRLGRAVSIRAPSYLQTLDELSGGAVRNDFRER